VCNNVTVSLCVCCWCVICLVNKTKFITTTLSYNRMFCFSEVHSVMIYGIIFWGNSPHSVNVFKIQKHIIRITSDSCRELFRDLKILSLYSQYIFSLSLFVVENKDQYKSKNSQYKYKIYSMNLHLPTSGLAV
jgi:hypothetical protein